MWENMHFGVFLGGLTMLVGSCVIVCVCKNCKRRNAQKRMVKATQMRPPSISLTIDTKADTAAYLNSIHILESPMLVTKICPHLTEGSPKSRTSSKDSCDSTKGLLGQRDSNPSPPWLDVHSYNEEWSRKANGSIRVIPTIYIESVPANVA